MRLSFIFIISLLFLPGSSFADQCTDQYPTSSAYGPKGTERKMCDQCKGTLSCPGLFCVAVNKQCGVWNEFNGGALSCWGECENLFSVVDGQQDQEEFRHLGEALAQPEDLPQR